ncbi:hypothetical protein CWR53_01200 [Pseudomonas sp. SGAir0191]|uniref:hypothetical protein n=1 Tax=Pseudomonas sp. SGAir0191 TaxID=2217867 RepID=UPI000C2C9D2E|nr:hypothetical protein [Pseudomonas sp. SGAir0191]AUA31306.1 hypothetical protein CWR53_01200 [Pseudomonas sp. SGAir0191]
MTRGDELLIPRPIDIHQLLHTLPGFGELLPGLLPLMAKQHDSVCSDLFMGGHPQLEPLVI